MKRIVLALAATSALAACGNDFDPMSAILGVRVLGVRVETPYVKPGSKPKLEMLLVDGSKERATRKIQVVWFHGCKNPKGDIFYECYPDLARRLGEAYAGKAQPIEKEIPGLVSFGTTAIADVPADTISARPPAAQGAFPQGRAFVFFAACAGQVTYDPDPPNSSGAPVRCVDPRTNEDLSADDFVWGYTPLFVFDRLEHAHPVIEGIAWDGAGLRTETCDQGCAPGYACGSKNRCLPVVALCTNGKSADCPRVGWKPIVSRASAEIDPIASALDQSETRESIYVEYAAINGRFERGAAVVNDPKKGWNDLYDGMFQTFHADPGEATLYAVVRDNRGGQTWATVDVIVR